MLRTVVTIIFISCISQVHAHTNDECMASALYYEANTEEVEGQRAVYDVIMNRALDSGKSICQVVKQRNQFSWWPSKPIRKLNKEMKEMLTNVRSTPRILLISEMWFFRKELKPKWARRMTCQQIGSHKFCRLKEKDVHKKRMGKASK